MHINYKSMQGQWKSILFVLYNNVNLKNKRKSNTQNYHSIIIWYEYGLQMWNVQLECGYLHWKIRVFYFFLQGPIKVTLTHHKANVYIEYTMIIRQDPNDACISYSTI